MLLILPSGLPVQSRVLYSLWALEAEGITVECDLSEVPPVCHITATEQLRCPEGPHEDHEATTKRIDGLVKDLTNQSARGAQTDLWQLVEAFNDPSYEM